MKDIRILLVDDNEIAHQGVRAMLEPEEDMEIVGDCTNAEDALSQVEMLFPNIVLMEVKMPGMDGIEACRRLKTSGLAWDVDVIMLTAYAEYLVEALRAKAAGYLLKDISHAELAQAIRQVYSLGRHDDSSTLVEEIELAIPPPVNAHQLLEFVDQMQQKLQADILQTVGSWDDGTAVTIQLQRPTPLVRVLDKLRDVPNVEKVKRLATRDRFSSFHKKFRTVLRSKIIPRKMTLMIALKQAGMTRHEELAGLRMN